MQTKISVVFTIFSTLILFFVVLSTPVGSQPNSSETLSLRLVETHYEDVMFHNNYGFSLHGGRLELWDITSKRVIRQLNPNPKPKYLRLRRYRDKLIALTENRSIEVWDLDKLIQISAFHIPNNVFITLTNEQWAEDVFGLGVKKMETDGTNLVLTESKDPDYTHGPDFSKYPMRLHIYKLATGEKLTTLDLPEIMSAFAINNHNLVFSSSDFMRKHLHVWNWETQKHLFSLNGHHGKIVNMAFYEGFLYTLGMDATVKKWRLDTQKTILTFTLPFDDYEYLNPEYNLVSSLYRSYFMYAPQTIKLSNEKAYPDWETAEPNKEDGFKIYDFPNCGNPTQQLLNPNNNQLYSTDLDLLFQGWYVKKQQKNMLELVSIANGHLQRLLLACPTCHLNEFFEFQGIYYSFFSRQHKPRGCEYIKNIGGTVANSATGTTNELEEQCKLPSDTLRILRLSSQTETQTIQVSPSINDFYDFKFPFIYYVKEKSSDDKAVLWQLDLESGKTKSIEKRFDEPPLWFSSIDYKPKSHYWRNEGNEIFVFKEEQLDIYTLSGKLVSSFKFYTNSMNDYFSSKKWIIIENYNDIIVFSRSPENPTYKIKLEEFIDVEASVINLKGDVLILKHHDHPEYPISVWNLKTRQFENQIVAQQFYPTIYENKEGLLKVQSSTRPL